MQIVYRLLFSVSRRSSISAGANSDGSDAVAEADVVLPKKGMVLPFQPLSIAFNHINYFIDMPPVSSAFYTIRRIYSFLLVMLGSKCGLLWGFLFGIFFSIAFNFCFNSGFQSTPILPLLLFSIPDAMSLFYSECKILLLFSSHLNGNTPNMNSAFMIWVST
jgi:hypothetical protein